MRIGIALFQFFPGRVGGAGDYIERVIPEILRVLGPDEELHLLGNAENLEPFRSLTHPRLNFHQVSWSRRKIQILRLLDLLLPFSPSQWFGRQFSQLGLDVLLCPQQSIFPRGIRVPTVVTVVDLLHFCCPNQVSPFQRWLRRRKERHLIRHATHIISISQATRSDLLKYYPVAPETCFVVYLAGKTSHHKTTENPVPPGASYVYYPATAFPHKNHARLLCAFQEFRASRPAGSVRLVLSGQKTPHLSWLLSSPELSRDVLHLGYISREQVAAVYTDARAVIIPSLFEGFGMPLIEGLGYGRPVFCSDLLVFRELAGDLVHYFDPTTEQGIIAALEQIYSQRPALPNPADVHMLLHNLTWERCGQETLAILRKSSGKSAE